MHLVGHLAIHQHQFGHGAVIEGMCAKDDDVGVLAYLQAAYPVGHADDLGRVDGDGLYASSSGIPSRTAKAALMVRYLTADVSSV